LTPLELRLAIEVLWISVRNTSFSKVVSKFS